MPNIRQDNEMPEVINKWGWQDHHLGGIEWMRFEKDSPISVIVFFLSVFVFIAVSCGQASKKQAEAASEKETLQAIYTVIDSIGFVKLPYKACYGQEGAIFVEGSRRVSYGSGWTFGVLPDTSNFFGILSNDGASSMPYLATFDKKGNLINRTILGEENCWEIAGESLLCDEYTIVDKDLTLYYYYYSKHLWESESGEYDALECKHFEKKGKIDKVGKIIFEERKEIPVNNCGQYKSFSLDSFPKEWINLTMHENKYVIYQSCNAGNRQWRFSKNNDKYELLIYGTQEDYDFEIDKTYKINDTIFIESKWKDSKEIKNFKILWDKDRHLMQTMGYFDTWDLFVEDKNASDYEVYNQPCRECWGDECDEIDIAENK